MYLSRQWVVSLTHQAAPSFSTLRKPLTFSVCNFKNLICHVANNVCHILVCNQSSLSFCCTQFFVSDLPRYQVKDTQESSGVKPASSQSSEISSSQSGGHGVESGSSGNGMSGFRPLYLPNSTQACHCSACVGAVAANVHPVSVCLSVCLSV